MKKLAFILAATVSFSFVANAQKKFIDSDRYGLYHNELMKVYKQKYSNDNFEDFLEIYNRLAEAFEEMHPGVLTATERDFYAKRVSEIIGNKTDARTFDFNAVINAGAEKYYSGAIKDFLLNIFEKKESAEVNLEKITVLKKQSGLSKSEIEELNKFESLLKSSVEYWNSGETPLASRCCAGCQVIIADVAGAMFGEFGAAGFSLFVNYVQDSYHNGGCM